MTKKTDPNQNYTIKEFYINYNSNINKENPYENLI